MGSHGVFKRGHTPVCWDCKLTWKCSKVGCEGYGEGMKLACYIEA